ncbi:MAG: hypothetical protein M5U26_15775 [Planctomycetota bacterium]|nr:hypothetical protein [Planctomycetota bacterium]
MSKRASGRVSKRAGDAPEPQAKSQAVAAAQAPEGDAARVVDAAAPKSGAGKLWLVVLVGALILGMALGYLFPLIGSGTR